MTNSSLSRRWRVPACGPFTTMSSGAIGTELRISKQEKGRQRRRPLSGPQSTPLCRGSGSRSAVTEPRLEERIFRDLTTPACTPAVVALVARPVARHDTSADRARRRIRRIIHRHKGQRLLRFGLRWFQQSGFSRFAYFREPEEPVAQPPEDIVDNRFRIRHLWIVRPSARLKSHVAEFIHE